MGKGITVKDMTIPETKITSNTSSDAYRPRLGRGLATIVAAVGIAVAGTTMLPAQEAQAAGVQTTNYTNVYAAPAHSDAVAPVSERNDA